MLMHWTSCAKPFLFSQSQGWQASGMWCDVRRDGAAWRTSARMPGPKKFWMRSSRSVHISSVMADFTCVQGKRRWSASDARLGLHISHCQRQAALPRAWTLRGFDAIARTGSHAHDNAVGTQTAQKSSPAMALCLEDECVQCPPPSHVWACAPMATLCTMHCDRPGSLPRTWNSRTSVYAPPTASSRTPVSTGVNLRPT